MVGQSAGAAPEATILQAGGQCWCSCALKAESDIVAQAMLRVPDLEALSTHTAERLNAVEHYTRAYQQYCWPVRSLGDLKLAPFHVLASEGAVHTAKPHTWHMEMIGSSVLQMQKFC